MDLRLSLLVLGSACLFSLISASGRHLGNIGGNVHIGRGSGGLIGRFTNGKPRGILLRSDGGNLIDSAKFGGGNNFFSGGFNHGEFSGGIFGSEFGPGFSNFGTFDNFGFSKLGGFRSTHGALGNGASLKDGRSGGAVSSKGFSTAGSVSPGVSEHHGRLSSGLGVSSGRVSGLGHGSANIAKLRASTKKLSGIDTSSAKFSGLAGAQSYKGHNEKSTSGLKVYDAKQSSLIDLQSAHAGLQSAHAGLQRAHADLQSKHAGIQSAHAGFQGSQADHQRINVGLQSAHAGDQSALAGLLSGHADVQNVHAGVQNVHAGVQNVHTGVQNIHAGVQNVHAGVHNIHAGVQNAQAGSVAGGFGVQGQEDQFGGLGDAHLITGISGIPGRSQVLAKANLGKAVKGGRFNIGSVGNSLVDQALSEVTGGEVTHSFWKNGQLHTTIVIEEELGKSQFSEAELAQYSEHNAENSQIFNDVSSVGHSIGHESAFHNSGLGHGNLQESGSLSAGLSSAVQSLKVNKNIGLSGKVQGDSVKNLVKNRSRATKSHGINSNNFGSFGKVIHPSALGGLGVTFKNSGRGKLGPTIIKGKGIQLNSGRFSGHGLTHGSLGGSKTRISHNFGRPKVHAGVGHVFTHSGHGASDFIRHGASLLEDGRHSGLGATSFVNHGLGSGFSKHGGSSFGRHGLGALTRGHRATSYVHHSPTHPFGEGLEDKLKN